MGLTIPGFGGKDTKDLIDLKDGIANNPLPSYLLTK